MGGIQISVFTIYSQSYLVFPVDVASSSLLHIASLPCIYSLLSLWPVPPEPYLAGDLEI